MTQRYVELPDGWQLRYDAKDGLIRQSFSVTSLALINQKDFGEAEALSWLVGRLRSTKVGSNETGNRVRTCFDIFETIFVQLQDLEDWSG